MTTIQRANVILSIEDDPDLIKKYKEKGYNVIDKETGKIIERAVPHDVETMRAYILELEERVRKYEVEIKKLTARRKAKDN